MTRGKPSILSRKTHDRARAEKKQKGEEAFQAGDLPKAPPVELKDMPAGQKTWRQLIKINSRLPAPLYNDLDRGYLINYCVAVEALEKAGKLEAICWRGFIKGKVDLDGLLKSRVELRMATRLVADLSRGLYISPKSRAGVYPDAKELTPEEIIERELDDLDL